LRSRARNGKIQVQTRKYSKAKEQEKQKLAVKCSGKSSEKFRMRKNYWTDKKQKI